MQTFTVNRLPQSHLINIIKSTRDHHPNFVLMLGAGSSVTSKVKLAKDMIREWREKHYEMYKHQDERIEEHLKKQSWYETSEEYSILFEKLFDQPSQRREYIETCIKNANPSWGYIYLVNLLMKQVFNTVFTTNFDDLLNEACYSFSSEVRPIVCAHDSSISSIRITSSRPKIIKLHGDFLFDNIKNTIRELESLEQNTQDKFKQYASEFGFIVLGYSGNDRSVMDTFNTLLKFDNYFPHGIYWCVRKGSHLSSKVDLLSRYPKFKIVEIDGFDEFFADLHSKLDIPLQLEMSDPYSALVRRLNTLTEITNIPDENTHPVIEKDIRRLVQKIISSSISVDTGGQIETLPIPYGFLADSASRNKKYDEALKFRIKEIENTPNQKAFVGAFDMMFKSEDLTCENKLLKELFAAKNIFTTSPMGLFDIALLNITAGKYENADKILDFSYELYNQYQGEFSVDYYYLNKLQIKKHKGEEFTAQEIKMLNEISKSDSLYTKFGAFSLLDRVGDAENTLLVIKAFEDIGYINRWPISKFIKGKLSNPELKSIFI